MAIRADKDTAPDIESTGPIKPGDSDARVPALVTQLRSDAYLPNGKQEAGSTLYTQTISEAVAQLQRDYGIAADGVVGPDTLKVLNFGADDRARALAVALERRRWLSRTPPATRIDVNVAAAELLYYRDGKLVDERKVIVGQPGKETPFLLAPIYRLVANPTWTVPKSIQRGELAGVSGPYLKQHDMVKRGGWIVQRSGPSNALGLVKFDMRDDVAIYLHDTSNRALFDRSQRHLTHGCVRVDDALGFADRLAEEEGVADRWHQARASGKQTFVPLPREIPVRLLY
ncbi:Murein L,D-transpeptidase YcbB/YkuD [Sphingomonas antarctica]|uniref:L,D-transpeptidase family protein n=1 Tax=Sphingomonas antarctica TaxID=2040274 RepID=UPI0039E85753